MKEDVKDLLLSHVPRLRRFAYALTGDADRGDDLVQDTLVRALTHIDGWQPGSRMDSWMFKIAQNLWFDRIRANKSRGVQADLDSIQDLAGGDGRDVTESRLTLGSVTRSMASLPEDQRVLVALVCVDGCSYKEAAARLGIPIGTVMSRLARARQSLHKSVYGTKDEDVGFPVEAGHVRNH